MSLAASPVKLLEMPNHVPSLEGSDGHRIEWIDIARGIGIILVVYGHVLGGLVGAHLITKDSPLWFSDYAIYTFHMPLFFVLAGLNVQRSIQKGKGAFILGKLLTIAYPYCLWSTIQGMIQSQAFRFAPSSVNHAASPSFMEGILRYPIGQFWFLYALFKQQHALITD